MFYGHLDRKTLPRFSVVHRQGHQADTPFGNFKMMNKPVTAIRVLNRIEDDDRIAHDAGNPSVTARGQQVVSGQHGCLCG